MTNRTAMAVVGALLACIAAAGSAQVPDVSRIVALHSFADVPSLPSTMPALFKRYGDVTQPVDETEKGDTKSEVLRQRINGWLKPSGTPSAMGYSGMGQGGAMNPAAAQALGQLSQVAMQLNGDYTQTLQTYHSLTIARLDRAYEDKVDQINAAYQPLIEKCLGEAERGRGGACDPSPQRNAAVDSAGAAFLKKAAGPYEDLKAKMKQIAAHGEAAIGNADKAFGGSVPGIARSQIMMIRQVELTALMAVLTEENDLVTLVYSHSSKTEPGVGED